MPSTTPKRIGLLGGTFDPVHKAHLMLAQCALEQLQLDQVRFIPARPWQKRAIASEKQRLQMLSLALEENEKFVIDDRELRNTTYSYTINTLSSLRQELGPEVCLYLILGSDQWHNLSTWIRWEEFISLVNLAIASRNQETLLNSIPASYGLHMDLTQASVATNPSGLIVHLAMPPLNISSRQIRRHIKDNSVGNELTDPVQKYIRQQNLYR